MSSKKSKVILAATAGAAMSLSATALVAVQDSNASGERIKELRAALTDGMSNATVTQGVLVAQGKGGRTKD